MPHNLNAYIPYGNREAAERAIEHAEVVLTQEMRVPRTINNPLEPRGAVGQYDAATGEYTLYASSQSPHNHRLLLALMIMGIPFNKVRLVAPNIGGSFGTKGYVYSDMPLVLLMAREIGRPVKWVDTRSGMMRSTVQGRDQHLTITIAGTRDGKITALKCTTYANLGAYPSTIGPGVATAMIGRSITGVYDIAHPFCEVYAVFTNRVPLGAQRGIGPRRGDLRDRAHGRHVRPRNRHGSGRDRGARTWCRPTSSPSTTVWAGSTTPATMSRRSSGRSIWLATPTSSASKAEARARGKHLGIGIGAFVAVSGVGPSPRMSKEGMLGGTWESA